jgi:GNAT superfamily N-acetyltransferase
MPSMKIRDTLVGDRLDWLALWSGYNDFYLRKVEERTTQRTWTALVERTGQTYGFVAEMNGHLVGFANYFFIPSTSEWNPRCYMQDLFTDPSARGQGVGRALIEAVYAEADAQYSSQVYWLTDKNNHVARKLYDRVASCTPFVKYKR